MYETRLESYSWHISRAYLDKPVVSTSVRNISRSSNKTLCTEEGVEEWLRVDKSK